PRIEQRAYRDTWGRGLDSYLQWMSEALGLLRDLLADRGSLFIHLDATLVHYAKCIGDEVFSGEFRSEIIWHHNVIGTGTRAFPKSHETLLWFSKGDDWYIDSSSPHVRVPYSDRIAKNLKKDDKGYYYVRGNRDSSGNVTGKWFRTYVDLAEIEGGKLAADVWDDIKSYRAQGPQSTGYPTQKPEKLLQRVVGAFSPPGGLVLDAFCGSGTTAAVAEKLGRRWVTCDMGRLSIHTTRKRLLGIPGVRPFVVQDLGPHERRAWAAQVFDGAARRTPEEHAHRRFILDLYGAEPIALGERIHGAKDGRFVHVGAIDLPVTPGDVNAIVGDVPREAGAAAPSIDILGWEFAPGLSEVTREITLESRVKLRFKYIPRDVLDSRAIERGDVRAGDFLELRGFSVTTAVERRVATIALVDFVMPAGEVAEDVRKAVEHWSQWIDDIAIDWDFKGGAFRNEWHSLRGRAKPEIELSARHRYEQRGTYAALVKVVDIFGVETVKPISIEIS
ncbi:MAG: DNA methyltransferase, partial [Polyangiaceae bacterium]